MAELGCVPGISCDAGVFSGDPQKTVRLGNGGILAVAMAWAAFARTPARAALRPFLAICLAPALTAILLYGSWWAIEQLDGPPPTGAPYVSTVGEYAVVPSFAFAVSALATLVVIPALMLSGVCARAAPRTTAGARRRVLTAGALSLVLLDGMLSLVEGAEAASVVALLSAAWLLWAIRLAAERPRRPSAPEPAGAVTERSSDTA